MKSTFAERLKEIMEITQIKQSDIVEKTGIPKSAISQYLSGKFKAKSDRVYILAKLFSVSETWLMGYDVPMERETSNIRAVVPTDKIKMIPLFESVSAGFGAYASDEVIDYVPFVVNNPADAPNLIAIKVDGNSMYPKIENGDTIVVRRQTSVDSGSIAVLLLEGEEGLVKKVNYGDDWIELVSINPEYPVRRFEGEDVLRLQVVGLVVKIMKDP